MGGKSFKTNALGPHNGWVSCMAPCTVPGTDIVLSTGSYDMTVRYWKPLNDGLECIGGQPCANVIRSMVSFELDGSQTVVVGESAWDVAFIEILDVTSCTVVRKLTGHTMAILDVGFIDTGATKYIISGSADQEVRVYNLSDSSSHSKYMFKHTHRVLTVHSPILVPVLAFGSYDASIVVMPKFVEEGETTHNIMLDGHTSHVTKIRFMPSFSGINRLASCSYDGTVRIWDIEKATNIHTYNDTQNDAEAYHDLSWHPNGELLVTGAKDHKVRVWDQRTQNCVMTLTGHTDFVLSVHFGSNGLIYSGSKDRTVRVWDIRYTNEQSS